MKQILSLSLIFILLFGCKKDETKSIVYPINIPFITVAKGEDVRGRQSAFPIIGYKSSITDSTQWNIVLSELDSLILPNNPDVIIRKVDFNNFQLLSAIDTVRYSGGWSIDIISVTEFQNNIEVKFDNLEKGNDATTGAQPYHIVRIPKQSKPIVFKQL